MFLFLYKYSFKIAYVSQVHTLFVLFFLFRFCRTQTKSRQWYYTYLPSHLIDKRHNKVCFDMFVVPLINSSVYLGDISVSILKKKKKKGFC
ncbi:hypothetical protein EDC96DRAFT_496850 [Choanephora cucurbitarum]|nr:hypothetical protein EDC96DRAFT_496850 [Choanephora cucurbitarum]